MGGSNIARQSWWFSLQLLDQKRHALAEDSMTDIFIDAYYGLLYHRFPVHVKLLTEVTITIKVEPSYPVQYLFDQIRQMHASHPLKWPSTRRGPRHSKRFPVRWDTPAALRLLHRDLDLDGTSTLAQAGVHSGSQLSAHMYFSQSQSLGEINTLEMHQRRVKRGLAHEHEDIPPSVLKRQKFNEPLRNQHLHQMINLSTRLLLNDENAARYGMDVDDMEDLLKELDDIDGSMIERDERDDWKSGC